MDTLGAFAGVPLLDLSRLLATSSLYRKWKWKNSLVLTDGYVRLTLGANFEKGLLYTSFSVYVKLIHGFAPCKAIRIPESGNVLPMESRVREIFASGIRIPLTIGIRNPRTSDKKFGIHGVEYRIQDCLGLSYMGGMETLLIIFQSIYSGKSAPMRRLIVAAEFIYFDPWTLLSLVCQE